MKNIKNILICGAGMMGKNIGYASGTSSETILRWTLEEAGLSFDDITAYEMDASAITSAMTSGSLDACATWSPSSFTILENTGDDAFILSDNLTFSDRTASIASWIVMPSFAEENHDLLVSFVKASVRSYRNDMKGLYAGMDYRAEHEDEVIGWVAEVLGTDFDTVYAQRGDAEWLTSAELAAQIADGTIESLYEVQKVGFGENADQSATIDSYVLFDVMTEAAS